MLGQNIHEIGAWWDTQGVPQYWPACGEVDIMEHWGNNQDYVSSAMHTLSSFGNTINVGGRTIPELAHLFILMPWNGHQLKWCSVWIVLSITPMNP